MLKDFIRYYKPYKTLFLVDFCCAIIVALLELLFPVIVNQTIDNVLPSGDFYLIIWIGMGLLFLYLFNTSLNFIVVSLGHRLGIHIETDMRRELFHHIQQHSYEYFDEVKTGELMSRLTSDLFDISEMAHHGPEDMFIALMTLVGTFYLMIQVHPVLAWGSVILIPILGIVLSIFNQKMIVINRTIFKQIGAFSAGLENSLSGIRVVKAFSNESHEKERFEEMIQNYKDAKVMYYNTMGWSSSFNYVLMRCITLFALIAGSYFTLRGELTTGQLVGFVLLSNLFIKPIERLNIMLEMYPKGFAGFKRFKEELNRKPAIVDSEHAYVAPRFQGEVCYEGVSFGYDVHHLVLQQVDLKISAGETIAFVGPSGAGKSTLVNLIPRFYDIQHGRITIDGTDIRQFTQESLRKQIGIVQQDVFLFNGTIRENVLYGRLDATQEEVEEAIRKAKLQEVIEDLPDGLDTQIGERGVKLSGGQKQRLSIARIFLKNPSILILDEATSALDTQTEQFIQQSFDELAKGRTTLIIAHRLATIQHAHRIVVVTPQGLVEDGTHETLMQRDGVYASLYRAQFGVE